MKIWILVGTRPDVIKQMPVYLACCDKFGQDEVALIGTGQHRELLDQALDHFKLRLNHDLNLMKPGGSLTELSAAILRGMDLLFRDGTPDWLLVQGDTTSAAMASWAGFQNQIKVAHSEAGLRSYDLQNPYPEEATRRLISLAARGRSTFSELRWYPPMEAAKGSLSWVFRAKQPESVRTGP